MPNFLWLLTTMAFSSAAAQLQFITPITDGISKEVSAVADPVAKTIAAVGSSQCNNVKKILGVDYESFNGEEPDLSKLTLSFITKGMNATYALSEAARHIPKSEWFEPNKTFYIYMHGFTDDPSKESYTNISNAFLSKGDCNIVALDASSMIRWLYLRSTTMVRFVGGELGKCLAAVVKAGVKPHHIHLIGHSLGAHIAGFAGKTFQNLTGHELGRISGLDPAGPCFSEVPETLRLHRNDANFVDVIHSDAGVYGMDKPIGHVDFWPNSGSQQPKCLFQTCSHSRAWLLFSESVMNEESFMGVRCDDWNQFKNGSCDYGTTSLMGFGCKPGTKGNYYLQTNTDIAFGRGIDGLKFINKDGIVRNLFG